MEKVDEQESDNALIALKLWRVKNNYRLTTGTLNVNTIPNKVHDLSALISNNLDILVVEDTKIDDSFSDESIKISGFKHETFRQDKQ